MISLPVSEGVGTTVGRLKVIRTCNCACYPAFLCSVQQERTGAVWGVVHRTGKGHRAGQPGSRPPEATWVHVDMRVCLGLLRPPSPLPNTACLSDRQGEELSIKSDQEEENENLRKGLALDLSNVNSTLGSLLPLMVQRLYTRRDGQLRSSEELLLHSWHWLHVKSA